MLRVIAKDDTLSTPCPTLYTANEPQGALLRPMLETDLICT